jgi:hypothetical protein
MIVGRLVSATSLPNDMPNFVRLSITIAGHEDRHREICQDRLHGNAAAACFDDMPAEPLTTPNCAKRRSATWTVRFRQYLFFSYVTSSIRILRIVFIRILILPSAKLFSAI